MKDSKSSKAQSDAKILKAEKFEFRLLLDERKAFQSAADIAGLSLSAWVRARLRRAAVRELEEAALPVAFLKGTSRR